MRAPSIKSIDRPSAPPIRSFHVALTSGLTFSLPSNTTNPTTRLRSLGGSTTECCAVAEDLRFPALVSSELALRGLRVTTLNAGNSGNTVHDSINILLNHVIQDGPDFVVLMHACNDVGLLSRTGNYGLRSGVHVGWSNVARTVGMKLSHACYVMGIIRQVAREHTHFAPTDPENLEPRPKLEVSESHDGAFEQRLRAFVFLSRSLNTEPVLMTQPISSQFTKFTPDWVDQDAQARFNEIIRRVGQEHDVLVIDLVDHLKHNVPNWDQHMHLFYDGIHVTDQGSRIYGEYIASILSELLRTNSAKQNHAPHRTAVDLTNNINVHSNR